jgi:hypothetical protein
MRDDPARINHMTDFSIEIDELGKEIDENAAEERKVMRIFDDTMNNFASDRSLDTCLDALNASIQLASVRRKLFLSYKHYSELLESEIVKLTRQRPFRSPE